MLQQLKDWAGFIRDLGLIIGVPTLIIVGTQLYELQVAALKEQKEVLKERNDLLKDTQYDRARDIIRAQKELFDMEREQLQKQISDARQGNQHEQDKIAELEKQVRDRENLVKALNGVRVQQSPDGGVILTTPTANIGIRG